MAEFWKPEEVRAALMRTGLDSDQAAEIMGGFKGEPGSGPERVQRYFRYTCHSAEQFEALIRG